MKKITNYFKQTLAVIFVLLSFTVTAQTVYENSIDGVIYFKTDMINASDVRSAEGILNIEDIPFLRDMVPEYGIYMVEQPFYRSDPSPLHDIYKISFDDHEMVDQLINELMSREGIEYAERAPIYRLHLSPNDTYYNQSSYYRWHLTLIDAEQAWDITTGSSDVKVAVIDNAIWTGHSELDDKVVAQIDLGNDDNDPTPPSTIGWSHGTHTSGLVCAETNNNSGVASIGFDISLIAIKAGKDDNPNNVYAGYEGMSWAADNDADVISMSYGSNEYYETGQHVADYCYNKGCVMLASAGNEGNQGNPINYPAAYDHVIAVGSVNGNDTKASSSQYGTWIDVMSPGGTYSGYGVFSTAYTGYTTMSGTSMACPVAAGLCGLILSVNPNLTPDKVEEVLETTCDNIDVQNPSYVGQMGAGRINAYAAVQEAQNTISTVYADFTANSTLVSMGGSIDFTDLSVGSVTSWSWTFEGGTPNVSNDQDPSGIVYNTAGDYYVTLEVTDGTNNNTETKTAYIRVLDNSNSAWIIQASGYAANSYGVYDLSIADPFVVWGSVVDGSDGSGVSKFVKTTNGGVNWTNDDVAGAPASSTLADIYGMNTSKAWLVFFKDAGGGGYIYATKDGGTSWEHQSSATYSNASSFPNVVHFFNENEGFCMGDPINGEFEIYTTSDTGDTWTLVDGGNIPDPSPSDECGWTTLYEAIGDVVWFGTNKGRVFKSTDKGHTWTVVSTGLSNIDKIEFNDLDNGIIQDVEYDAGGSGEVISFEMKVTHNGGSTWSDVTPGSGIFKNDIAAIPGVAGKFISVGNDGTGSGGTYGSAMTEDYGVTWTNVDEGTQYISVEFYDDNTGWAGGYSSSPTMGGVYKWRGDETGVEEDVIVNYNSMIYPNPSTGRFNLRLFGLEKKTFTVSVYDLLGKLVYNRTYRSYLRIFNTSLDLSNVGKGMYIVIVDTPGQVLREKVIIE